MYIAPGKGQTTLWGQNFYVNRNSLSLCPFVASLPISLKSDLFTIFYVGISTLWHFRLPLPIQMFIKVASSPRLSGIGMPSPILWSHPLKMQRIVLLSTLLWWELGTNSLITGPGEWLSFRRFTSKLSWSWSWCVFFQMYIAPGRGRQPTEDKNFITTERAFLFAHMLQVSKWSLWNLILYTFFNYFIHVYSPEARADKPLGSKFWCQQKALTTSTICCKKNLFELYTFLHVFSHVYIAPGQGQTTLCGQNSDVNRKALSLCPFVASLVIEKKIFEGTLQYIGVTAILVMWPRPREQTFIPPSQWGSIWNLVLIGQAVLEKKIFENGAQRPWLYYKLTNEPKGAQVS